LYIWRPLQFLPVALAEVGSENAVQVLTLGLSISFQDSDYMNIPNPKTCIPDIPNPKTYDPYNQPKPNTYSSKLYIPNDPNPKTYIPDNPNPKPYIPNHPNTNTDRPQKTIPTPILSIEDNAFPSNSVARDTIERPIVSFNL